jgi:hypothetical protein
MVSVEEFKSFYTESFNSCEAMSKTLDAINLTFNLGMGEIPNTNTINSLDGSVGSIMYFSMPVFEIAYVFNEVLKNISEDYFTKRTKDTMRMISDLLKDRDNLNEAMIEHPLPMTMSMDTFNKLQYVITALVENGTLTKWFQPQCVVDEAATIFNDIDSYSNIKRATAYAFTATWGSSIGLGKSLSAFTDILRKYCDEVFVASKLEEGKYPDLEFRIGSIAQYMKLMHDIRKTVGFSRFGDAESDLQDFLTSKPDSGVDCVVMEFDTELFKLMHSLLVDYDNIKKK